MVMRMVIGAVVGAVAGGFLGYWGRCRGGSCPLTGNPYSGAVVGMIVGVLLVLAIDGGSSRRRGGGLLPLIEGQKQFDSTVLRGGRTVLVEFSAEWCRYCGQLEPDLAELAARYAGRADFVKVDIDRSPDLAGRYGVSAVPVVVLFAGGKEAHRWQGVLDVEEYRRVLDGMSPPAQEQTPMTQQARSVTMRGKPVALEGNEVNVGDQAPDFLAVDTDMKDVRLSDYRGKVVLLLSVPSLDTSVCSLETRKFNEAASRLGPDVVILTVSMDLPFAQKRWCGAEGIAAVKTLSDHRQASFGQAYGVLMKDLRLLARAVFVIGRDGKVTYKQLVGEVGSEPDYDAALRAAAQAATG